MINQEPLQGRSYDQPASGIETQATALYSHLLSRGFAAAYSYIFSIPHKRRAWIGLSPDTLIRLYGNKVVKERDGKLMSYVLGDGNPFDVVQQLLEGSENYFYLASSDLARGISDPDLPLFIFVQPGAEIVVSEKNAPAILANCARLEESLAAALSRYSPSAVPSDIRIPDEQAPISQWHHESDSRFLKRLENAVSYLEGKAGKLIVTRGYHRKIAPRRNALRLYEIYSQYEPRCAASHFFNLGNGTYSLGCSPENIFELDRGTISVDVIASTRGVVSQHDRDERLKQQLLTDPKEEREHILYMNRCRQRLQDLCEDNTVTVEARKQVKEFRRVRHLYSLLSGRIKSSPPLTEFDLIKDSFPPLVSYPETLIPHSDPMTEPNRFYGGLIGRTSENRTCSDAFLNIRSILIKGEDIHTQGGVGIISGANPKEELLEVSNKLRCLMEAVYHWENE